LSIWLLLGVRVVEGSEVVVVALEASELVQD
jgi:hypothetical protein